MLKKTIKYFQHPIKKEILEVLKNEKGAFYGDIVMELNYPKYRVLKHLMKLKNSGEVFKDDDGGKFYLNTIK
ncbi:MAG: ArsR family transcriptional regulator [Bacteroidales bacterium]|nr:ArsR family transcriptional regulator [Bacteroidales bacterium]MCF8404616.1 ArsR family transcriptional regulator [Bacteroidales bacterium]